jgi:hemolysin activation/secretion protein
LVTQYSLLQTSISHDNYQTRYLGPQETTVYSNLNSLIVPGSSVLTHVLLSDTVRKLQFYEVQYKQVLGTEGLVVGVDAYNTETHPGFILTPLEILGSSSDITLSTTYPLIRSKLKNLYLTGQFELMNNYSDSFGQQLYHDKISDFALLTQFSNTLWKGDNSIILALYKGLNILGAPGLGFHSRGDASSDFFKTNLTMSREQYLGSMFSFYSLFTGQYANKPLFAAQQMAYGGPSIGRGYDLAQFIGDQGIAGKAELRLNTSTKWKFLNQVQYYAFYDAGKLYNYIDGFYALSGTSTGLGLRSTVLPHLNFEGFVAKPLTTPNATQVILKENGKAVQAYFQVTGYWSF